MAKDINPNIPPPQGFVFEESDGARMTGNSWAEIISRIKKYRENRRIPVGNVRADLLEQVCKRYPQLCKETSHLPLSRRAPTLKTRVYAWLGARSREQRGAGLDYVADSTAEARAAVCAKCPRRQDIPGGCSSCESSLAALRGSVLAGRKTVNSKLGACDVLGADLVCAVHLSEAPAAIPELPATCWRKK